MTDATIAMLTGGPPRGGGMPHLRTIKYVPQAQIGDGLAGPPNDQSLEIFRDTRPIATDELEGLPFHISKVARHRAGRTFPLNFGYGAWFDNHFPGQLADLNYRNARNSRGPSPLYPGQNPASHQGVAAAEVIPGVNTVYYTATPEVGWERLQ